MHKFLFHLSLLMIALSTLLYQQQAFGEVKITVDPNLIELGNNTYNFSVKIEHILADEIEDTTGTLYLMEKFRLDLQYKNADYDSDFYRVNWEQRKQDNEYVPNVFWNFQSGPTISNETNTTDEKRTIKFVVLLTDVNLDEKNQINRSDLIIKASLEDDSSIKSQVTLKVDDSIPVDAPKDLKLTSAYRGIDVSWSHNETIAYLKANGTTSDGDKAPPNAVTIAYIPLEDAMPLQEIDSQSFVSSSDETTEDLAQCSLDITDDETGCSVTCNKDGQVGLAPKFDSEDSKFKRITSSDTSHSISKLKPQGQYLVLLGYSKGLNYSCEIMAAGDNVSLNETHDVGKAGPSDARCFVATAAYGSPMDKRLDSLRWFRDSYLLTNDFGRKFVAFYYEYSPPLANFIAEHESLKTLTRILISPLVILAEALETNVEKEWSPL